MFRLAAPLVSALFGVALTGTPVVTASPAPAQVRPCSAGLVALTFDDGPARGVTPRLVAELRRARVPATFFMVGSRVETAPAAARLVARSGFVVGNHTWDHASLPTLDNSRIRRELRSTSRELRHAGVHPSDLMRPPYGALDGRVRKLIRSLRLHPVLWTMDSRDWAGGTGNQIAARVLGALRRHEDNVVLQHDGVTNSPSSVAAVPRIIREARRRGYCFTEVGADGRPVVPVPKARLTTMPGAEFGPDGRPVPVRIEVTLDRPTSRATSLLLRTGDASATAGADYRATTVRLRFPVGSRRVTTTIPVRVDAVAEPAERFRIELTEPRGLRLPTRQRYAGISADPPLA